jgi:predicted nucleotidyltransferase
MGDLPIPIPSDRLADFCRRNGIARLSLFGSILRDDFTPRSDVDVLVEFHPSARISLFDLSGMSVELSEIFGRKVDLRTPEDLSRYFRGAVLREARPLYAA